MPTISVPRKALFELLGHNYTDQQIESYCFDYGLELEDVTSERQQVLREKGAAAVASERHSDASDEILYKIEVPANRYDLLCVEGLAQNLLIFWGKRRLPWYRAVEPKIGGAAARQKLVVRPNTAKIRPFCVAAVLRNITFTKERYASFIDLQDKLHQNLCRKRTLVAIGTHDLDTVAGPFTYDALPPREIRFRALGEQQEHTAEDLMELYSHSSHLKPYLPIIRDSPVYPVIMDTNGVVLSMPPIINGEHSKLTLKTKNVLIECTATDLQKARIVLDTVVTMFSPYCEELPNCVEMIDIQQEKDGSVQTFPSLQYRVEKLRPDDVRKCIGVSAADLPDTAIVDSLNRMGLESSQSDGSVLVSVTIPPTRHDILHSCDIIEDVAVAYGFNNLPRYLPEFATIAQQFDLNSLCEKLRQEVVAAGYTEALSFTLCSADDIAEKMRKKLDEQPAVHILNPKSADFQVARTTLIPGLLKTLASNKNMPLPLKLFEVSDVVLADKSAEVGARNRRHLCAVYYGKTSGFEIIHGLLDHVMMVNEVVWSGLDVAAQGDSAKKPGANTVRNTYAITAHDDASFLPGRCAQIMLKRKVDDKTATETETETEETALGLFGVLHPDVLNAFELSNPVSVLEIDVENFLPISEGAEN